MGWIGLAEHEATVFDPFGLGADRHETPLLDGPDDAPVERGTLMIETRLSPERRPQPLLMFEQADEWGLKISLQAIPGGGITMVVAQGGDLHHCAVNPSDTGRMDVLRVTFSWDSPARTGFIAVERTDRSQVVLVSIVAPKPIRQRDLRALFDAGGPLFLSDDLVFLACATDVQPIGPTPSLAVDTPVLTPDGYVRARSLQRGDMVVTADGHIVPVLHRVDRTVPARGSFSPIRIRAPYFGLKEDIVVAPSQRLLISGSEVEYLFGHEAVYVPACHLAGASAGLHEDVGETVRLTQVLLPNHEAIVTAGSAAESLHIGRIRRRKNLLPVSLLGRFDRSSLPDHGAPLYPVLRSFDALVLAEHRAA